MSYINHQLTEQDLILIRRALNAYHILAVAKYDESPEESKMREIERIENLFYRIGETEVP